MSEQILEQVSAFLDGELPNSETELLLKRLTRDAELRDSFGRYALIGETLRGTSHAYLTKSFAERINLAIDGESLPAGGHGPHARTPRWWRPLGGAVVAASVAAVAVVALQHRAVAPLHMALPVTAQATLPARTLVAAQTPLVAQSHEALSYTVPATVPEAPMMLPAARLTNYVFAHSKYSSVLGQRGVLTDLLIDDDQPPAEIGPISSPPMTPAVHVAP